MLPQDHGALVENCAVIQISKVNALAISTLDMLEVHIGTIYHINVRSVTLILMPIFPRE